MKKQIKKWLRKWLEEEAIDYSPKFRSELKSVSFTSQQPVGNGKYHEYVFMCTEWPNGEGYEFNVSWHYEGKGKDRTLSLNDNEINGILACLNHFDYFEV
jgi:hypothetical protein